VPGSPVFAGNRSETGNRVLSQSVRYQAVFGRVGCFCDHAVTTGASLRVADHPARIRVEGSRQRSDLPFPGRYCREVWQTTISAGCRPTTLPPESVSRHAPSTGSSTPTTPPAHKSGRVTTSVTTGPGHHRLGLFDQARPSPANAHPIRARPVDPARRVYPAGIFDTEASL